MAVAVRALVHFVRQEVTDQLYALCGLQVRFKFDGVLHNLFVWTQEKEWVTCKVCLRVADKQ